MPASRSLLAMILAVVCCWGGAPAAAGATDEAASIQFLRAELRYLSAAKRLLPHVALAINTYVARSLAECPDAANEAPSGEELRQLREELIDAVSTAGETPLRAISASLSGRIAHLRWTDRSLTRLVHAYSVELRSIPSPPNLCAELAEWAASGYQTLPQTSMTVLSQSTSSTMLQERLTSRLLRDAQPRVKTMLRTVDRVERNADGALLALGLPAIARLEEGLRFPPSPAF
jgi:hypothetical protein